MKSIPLTGKTFGRLTVLVRCERDPSYWWCQCSCGTDPKRIYRGSLTRGLTRSCGCLWRETVAGANRTHQKTKTPIYRLWSMMLDRCRNPKNKKFARYGGRGIYVCAQWYKFENFYSDMGDRPKNKTLNRIDNDGPYTPTNCEWASLTCQGRNKSTNKLLLHKGKTQSLAAWAEELGINRSTLSTRLRRGWSVARALNGV